MFGNMLKIAWRNLVRNKMYSLLNIIGLSVGIACFIFIAIWVRHELSYDRFHENAENIYRIAGEVTTESEVFTQAVSSPPVAPNLKNDFPEVLNAVRFAEWNTVVAYGDKRFEEKNWLLADDGFFDMFSFPLLQGDPKIALSEPYTLVLTESFAQKYFGDENPMGKLLDIEGWKDFKVVGVMPDIPENSHFSFDFLSSFKTWEKVVPHWQDTWFWNGFYTYIQLPEEYDYKAFEPKLTEFGKRHYGDKQAESKMSYRYVLQPLTDIHLHSRLRYEIAPTGSVEYVYLFGTIGLFVLLIACINYMNLATARSIRRAKEAGVKKTLGASRWQLVRQHLLESFLFAFLALFLAIAIVELLLPAFQNLVSTEIRIEYSLPLIAFLAGLTFLVGLTSGAYPAFVLSSFQPAAILKGSSVFRGAGSGFKTLQSAAFLRKGLVVFQFTITIILLAGIGIVQEQMDYIHDKDLGFNKSLLVNINLERNFAVEKAYPLLLQDWKKYHRIQGVARSGGLVVRGLSNQHSETEDKNGKPVVSSVYTLRVDENYFDVYEMELLAGRTFSRDITSDSTGNVIVNEAAIHAFGWGTAEGALGKKFKQSKREGIVIGVVRDFHYNSLVHPIDPLAIRLVTGWFSDITLRIAPDNIPETLSKIENVWQSHLPETPLNFAFMDEKIARQYEAESQFGNIFFSFSVISMIIACLGLFGLAAYAAEQRTKEIGIRKVLGASVSNLIWLLTRQFTQLTLIAFVIAFPLTWFVMNQWLASFAFHIDIEMHIFLIAAAIALIISFCTVIIQALRAALANPVNALRYE